jgi:anti-sigma-K factor RskA
MNGHDELMSLLGAYALDAIDDDERRAVEEHLAGCAECRAEVARHLEVAAALGTTVAAAAPDDLWAAIQDHIDGGPAVAPASPPLPGLGDRPVTTEPPPSAPTAPVVDLAARRSRPTAWIAGLAVAAAVIVVLAAVVVSLSRTNADLEQQVAAPALEEVATAAMQDPANQVIPLASDTTTATATAVVTPSGDGYLLSSSLEPLPTDRTYQLWNIGDAGPVSLGVLGSQVDASAFHLQGPVGTLAITAEQAGGVPAPQGAPVVASTA